MDLGSIGLDDVKMALGIAKEGAGVVQAVTGVVSSLKGKPTVKSDELATALDEVLQKLINLRLQNVEIVERLVAAQEKLRDLQRAEDVRTKYRLINAPGGALVYALVEGNPEPPHFLCPACFNEGKTSILQPARNVPSLYVCSFHGSHTFQVFSVSERGGQAFYAPSSQGS